MKIAEPIGPDEVVAVKTESIPEEVFETFNELIARHYNGDQAVIYQDDVMDILMKKLSRTTHTADDVYRNHWLDVEDSYRAKGWSVHYDRPGFGETYRANFTFSRRK